MNTELPSVPQGPCTLGIEEEFQIVDPRSRELRPKADPIWKRCREHLHNSQEIQKEFHLSQIESASTVCGSMDEVRKELIRLRSELLRSADSEANWIIAAGTHPFSHWANQPLTPNSRYHDLAYEFQQLAWEQVIFGCHVHVGLEDADLGLEVMNRCRAYLPIFLALSANSPFWLGEDTGYASYRMELWTRWPLAGPPMHFQNKAEYDECVQGLIAGGMLEDASKIYWDIRLPTRFPTIEFRITDVCTSIDNAVMLAGLIRGVSQQAYFEAKEGVPYKPVRHELLRAAIWQAARFGIEGELIDLEGEGRKPAYQLIERALEYARPVLEAFGDWEEISQLVGKTLVEGNGAIRQRKVFQKRGEMLDVVDFLAEETARETEFLLNVSEVTGESSSAQAMK
ncbi:Carboxylate-amine ligase [Planctomycetales bacterium 10988]|nr:Carboxylate-amine ligase [Planctomycetales bacterium 10988]